LWRDAAVDLADDDTLSVEFPALEDWGCTCVEQPEITVRVMARDTTAAYVGIYAPRPDTISLRTP
jgi:hypothetical protein